MRNCKTCNVVLNAANQYKSDATVRICKPCRKERSRKSNILVSNPNKMFVNGKYVRKSHPLHKPGYYRTFNDAAFEGAYKAGDIKEGYVYIITNKAWLGWLKIGMAIDAEDRLNSYQTSSPMRDYVLEHSIASSDRRKAEKEAHTRALPLSLSRKGEWFKISLEQAITILDNLNEHRHIRATKKADTHKKEDNLQGSLF